MAVIRDVMPAFELFQPTSVDAALELLDRYGSSGWVLAGGLETPQGRLRAWESRYLSPGEGAAGCAAGESGVHLLVLQMPANAAAYAQA